jgi:hypothetical protein
MSQLGEIIQLGPDTGVVVALVASVGGMAIFSYDGGVATAYVYQARDPDVQLDGAAVGLIQQQVDGQNVAAYALLVDDPYWGRRIQPAQFSALPLTESFTLGYRLSGQIQENGVGVRYAPVSFAVTLQTAEDGPVLFWDSEEYNVLAWDDALFTYVSGSTVATPVMADAGGNWEYIVPKGHGAPYQRQTDFRDDTPETAAASLPRYVEQVCVAYLGRQVPVVEGTAALLNLDSAQVQITATPGATVAVGVMEDAGEFYTVPAGGVLTVGNLPQGWVSLVQFQQDGGYWDPGCGGQRARVAVREGQTASVDLGALVSYPTSGRACGRVFLSPGVPAVGAQITLINVNNAEIVGTAATTDASGWWTVNIPWTGLGGDPFIMDPLWGSVPVIGIPYSDIVLGARAYCAWMQDFRTAAWRTGTWGHSNFQWVPEAIWVVDNATGTVYPTQPAPYGGWMTVDPLPKWQYIADPVLLLRYGPQLKSYRLVTDHGVEDPDFSLRDQSFSGGADEPGFFRASGYYPEKKILLGGKLKYNVVLDSRRRIDQNWPEAARVGLEFGTYRPFVEVRVGAEAQG